MSNKNATPESWRIRPITRRDWSTIERLFGERGACGGCWCMSWRVPSHGQGMGGLQGRAESHEPQAAGRGWKCSCRDRSRSTATDRMVLVRPAGEFFRVSRGCERSAETHPPIRGQWYAFLFSWMAAKGLGTALLQAATERAFALGASEVEGFPAVPCARMSPFRERLRGRGFRSCSSQLTITGGTGRRQAAHLSSDRRCRTIDSSASAVLR